MTSFQLFKGMTGIDSEFLLQVERQDSPVSRRLHTKKLWLIAAIIALTLLLVGCAVAYVTILWGSPKEMIAGLYGENTGFDSAAPGEGSDPLKPGATWTIPGYEKLPVEETVAQELEKWVSPVGKSISAPGYKLTVDAYVYDSATQCGLMTMLLEHDEPISEENMGLGMDGRLGGLHGNYLNFNQYGWPYLIPEKTTDHLLAFTFYFRADLDMGTELLVSFPNFGKRDYTEGSTESVELPKIEAQLRAELTPDEAVARMRALCGDDLIDDIATHVDDLQSWAYFMLVNRAFNQAHMDEMVCVSLPDSGSLPYKTFGQGDIYVNSLCVWIRPSHYADRGDAIKTLIFHMTDGTDFVVMDDLTDNTVFQRIIEHDDLLCMLNSAINIEKIQSVEVAGEFGSAMLEGDVD